MKSKNISLVRDGDPIRAAHDGELAVSYGKSRFEKAWKNRTVLWSQLLDRLSRAQVTHETHAEYMKLPKARQDQIKDIGGFVGGHLKEGRRQSGSVACRQVLTLDMDFPPEGILDRLQMGVNSAYAVYSTHKHSAESPRLRLIIPLSRQVSPDEYEAIARKEAEKIGIDYFDDSTFQPSRLMYWPSCSADVEPVFRYKDAAFLDADKMLAEYPDWTDTSYWPESSRMPGIRKRSEKKQGNPLEKAGIVGTFCRAYSVTEAIEKFLPDIYTPTAKEDRYTYAAGSTAAGLVIYEDGLFAYSNHGTDPACGQLCNAFDLVRIHKFGHLDQDAPAEASGRKLPSFKEMERFCTQDPGVKLQIDAENRRRYEEDFGEDAPEEDWKEKLDAGKGGVLLASPKNAKLILMHDPPLKGIALNELSGGIEAPKEGMPWARQTKYWSNEDDAQLYMYVSLAYNVEFSDKIFQKAFTAVCSERRFNPLKDYVRGLPDWDGVQRVDRLLIDYLGAADTDYTRAVTRKTLIGAISRVLEPGCKFDTVLVLDGKTGIGKSTLLRRLGGEWFSDSLSLADTRDKTAAEKLRGVWIMEIGEMQGTRKADVDIMKGFISRQVDEYRPAYGRVVERHPRTCIICGTTNSTTGFLRDTTGNRRFWPVPVDGSGDKSIWDMTDEERDQIWAEAFTYCSEGEEPYLDHELEKEARKMQKAALEYDDREGQVADYLDTILPDVWYTWDTGKRIDFFQNPDAFSDADLSCTMQRKEVCALEIFCECFGRPRSAWRRQDGYEIAAIMARIEGWERSGSLTRVSGYGPQRVFERQTCYSSKKRH